MNIVEIATENVIVELHNAGFVMARLRGEHRFTKLVGFIAALDGIVQDAIDKSIERTRPF